jgi:hypothetical protein
MLNFFLFSFVSARTFHQFVGQLSPQYLARRHKDVKIFPDPSCRPSLPRRKPGSRAAKKPFSYSPAFRICAMRPLRLQARRTAISRRVLRLPRAGDDWRGRPGRQPNVRKGSHHDWFLSVASTAGDGPSAGGIKSRRDFIALQQPSVVESGHEMRQPRAGRSSLPSTAALG